MIPNHAQRCAIIVELARRGWLKPAYTHEHQEKHEKTCVECGARFQGSRGKKLCSHACKVKRDNRASTKRMQEKRKREKRGASNA